MDIAKKEIERIVNEFKIQPSKLLFVDDVSQEEINTWFEDIKKDLIDFINCSLELPSEYEVVVDWDKLKDSGLDTPLKNWD